MFRSKNRAGYAGVLSLFVIAGLAAAIWDLPVSRSLFNPAAGWAIWIEKYGEIPGLLAALWAFLVLNANISGSRASRYALYPANFAVCSLLLGYAIVKLCCGRLDIRTFSELAPFMARRGAVIAFASVVPVISAMVALRRCRPDYALGAGVFAGLAARQFIISQLLVYGLKTAWGRVRFRDLAPGFGDFTPWYLPQGYTGHSSFPSGHAALAWTLLPLLLLVPETGGLRKTVLWLVVIWGCAVSAGRVVIGAHYPSDVLAAAAVTVAPFLFLARRKSASLLFRKLPFRGVQRSD